VKPSCVRVLDALRAVGPRGLDAYDDFDLHGQGRLAARIADLRDDGYDISAENVTPPGRTRRAIYRIHERPTQLGLDFLVSAHEVPPLGVRAHQAAETRR
jgi:hypothetical protein